MNRILPRIGMVVLGLLVLGVVAVLIARMLFMNYLHSQAFRDSLGRGAANTLQADHAEFAPLQFDGSMVYGDNFHATRTDGGGFSSIDASQLRAAFDWHGLLHHTVQVDELSVQQLTIAPPDLSSNSAPSPDTGATTAPAPIGQEHPGWKVDLRKAVIEQANWNWSDDPKGGITGTALTLTPDGDNAWLINAQGGTMESQNLPALDLENASLRWQSPTLYINSANLRNGASRVAVTGSVEERQSVDLHVNLDGVDINPLLAPDWKERLTGRMNATLHVQAPLGDSAMGPTGKAITVSGSLSLVDGQLTALPILDEIGTFTHTERFRQLEFTRASADFTRTPERLDVHNMIIEAEGLIRVEGDYTVEDGEIAGTFQVGLTPETLQWIPGSQEQIFVDSHGGYRWSPMKLTGPVTHPVDDLTPRLIAATGNAVIKDVQSVSGAVKKVGQGVLDLLLH